MMLKVKAPPCGVTIAQVGLLLLLVMVGTASAQVRVENYRGRDTLVAAYPAVTPNYSNNASPSSDNLPNLIAFSSNPANIESTATETDINWANASNKLCNSSVSPTSAACQARRQGRVIYALIKFPAAGTYAFDVAHDDEVDFDFSTQFTLDYRNATYNVPVGSVQAYTANDQTFDSLGSFTSTGANSCFLMRIYWNNRGTVNFLRLRWDPPGSGTANREIVPASSLLDPADPGSITGCSNLISDLAVSKVGPATFNANGSLGYTLKVWNRGPTVVDAATVTDIFPTSLSAITWSCVGNGGAVCGTTASSANTRTQTTGNLPVNTSAVLPTTGAYLTISVTATANGTATSISNTATVSPPADRADDNPVNNTSTTVATRGNAPQLSMLKSHANPFLVGVNSSYQLSVRNDGTLASSGTITVVDTLPAGLTYVSASGAGWACTAAAQVVTCTGAAAIAIGATSPLITLTVTPTAAAVPSVINTARVSGGGDSTCPAAPATATARCSATDPTPVAHPPTADLSITKSNGTNSVVKGAQTTYAIVVTNHGDAVANAVLSDPASGRVGLTCTLPATCNSATSGACPSPTLTIAQLEAGVPLGNLPNGASVTVSLTCTVN